MLISLHAESILKTSCLIFQHVSTISLAGLLVKYFSVKYPVSFKENVRVTRRIILIDPGFISYITALNSDDLFTTYFHQCKRIECTILQRIHRPIHFLVEFNSKNKKKRLRTVHCHMVHKIDHCRSVCIPW